MMRHRSVPTPKADGSSSSSDDDDVFSALSRKKKGSKVSAAVPIKKKTALENTKDESMLERKLPVSTTSSNKRHHGASSDSRQAKMDALLLELEAEKHKAEMEPHRRGSIIPDKKGSFCEPGEEHQTTNIFVGNLAPSITEEEMATLFRQFGEPSWMFL
jgi:U2-associated protein SR140